MNEANTFKLTSLKRERSFARLRKGRPGHAKYLSAKWRPSNEALVRVGIVVNKKVGNAVTRNRVRRRLREALKSLLSESDVVPAAQHARVPSFHLILIARPEAATASYWELRSALKRALNRAKLTL